MARFCEICGKGTQTGRTVSHANNRTPRRFKPNLRLVRANVNGVHTRMKVCSGCLKAGKVLKLTHRSKAAAEVAA